MKKAAWMRLVLVLVVALAATTTIPACTSSRTSESTGEYVDDSVITAKVKTALLNDTDLKSFE